MGAHACISVYLLITVSPFLKLPPRLNVKWLQSLTSLKVKVSLPLLYLSKQNMSVLHRLNCEIRLGLIMHSVWSWRLICRRWVTRNAPLCWRSSQDARRSSATLAWPACHWNVLHWDVMHLSLLTSKFQCNNQTRRPKLFLWALLLVTVRRIWLEAALSRLNKTS